METNIMKLSFDFLLEQLEEKDVLMDSGEETKAAQIVRAGLNISPEFWDNFITLFSNSEGMSDLLGVQRERVASIPTKIKEIINNIESKDKKEKFV